MFVAFVALALDGCARGADPLLALLGEARAHVYHRPAPELRAAVQAELLAEGYTVEPTSDDGLVGTGWKMLIDGRELGTFRDRDVALVKRLTAHHCRVEAMRMTMSTLGSDTGHPLEMLVPAAVDSKANSACCRASSPRARTASPPVTADARVTEPTIAVFLAPRCPRRVIAQRAGL